ncbi:MAG: biopolymer transporter ExbD [Myxococcota bacterium]
MAGGSLYQDEDGMGTISDINVTPLVDVMLVLLIIYMIAAKLIVARGISVDSPRTASGDEVKSTLQVTIDKNRGLYVNGQPYDDITAAQAKVRDMHAENPNIKAIITADVTVPHGDVMQVIDFVKLAGVTKFALTSDPLGNSQAPPKSDGSPFGTTTDPPASPTPAGQTAN